MSDSIDRVFAHALQTVRRIPTSSSIPGTAPRRPPAEDRLRLYGLFKQSTEGDVEGVMERPNTKGEQGRLEREKWDAWYTQRSLSKTEAKRRYITTLIETMHKYASDTHESRELVSELEFVWNQVKSNQSAHTSAAPSVHSQPHYPSSIPKPPFDPLSASPPPSPSIRSRTLLAPPTQYKPRAAISDPGRTEKTISSLSVSNPDPKEGEEDDEDLDIDENVVLDRDESEEEDDDGLGMKLHRYNPIQRQRQDAEIVNGLKIPRAGPQEDEESEVDGDTFQTNHRMAVGPTGGTGSAVVGGLGGRGNVHSDAHWKSHIEKALAKMNAEVAALREQLESGNFNRSSQSWWNSKPTPSYPGVGRRKGSNGPSSAKKSGWNGGIRSSIAKFVLNVLWVVLKHIMVDAVVVGVVLWWMGKRGDRKAVEAGRWMRKRILGFGMDGKETN